MRILKGYATVREVNGMMIPVTTQHQIMRSYCEKNRAIYKLAQLEIVSKNSSLILISLLKDLSYKGNLIMCSVNMLPQSLRTRKYIYRIILQKKLNVHFVYENFIISNLETVKNIEFFFNLVDEIDNNCLALTMLKTKNFEILS